MTVAVPPRLRRPAGPTPSIRTNSRINRWDFGLDESSLPFIPTFTLEFLALSCLIMNSESHHIYLSVQPPVEVSSLEQRVDGVKRLPSARSNICHRIKQKHMLSAAPCCQIFTSRQSREKTKSSEHPLFTALKKERCFLYVWTGTWNTVIKLMTPVKSNVIASFTILQVINQTTANLILVHRLKSMASHVKLHHQLWHFKRHC